MVEVPEQVGVRTMRTALRRLLASGAVGVAVAAVAVATPAAARPTPARAYVSFAQASRLAGELRAGTLAQTAGVSSICASNGLACQAEILTTNKSGSTPLATPDAFPPQVGYGATELEKAYGLANASSTKGTIVVIGAGAYPTLESDLAIYRSTYHLPACTSVSGCFTQLNYRGGAPYLPATGLGNQFGEEDIGVETALDVDMASAACPSCKIISMQVPLRDGFFGNRQHTQNAIRHFATGVQTAHRLNAAAVSISYGYPTSAYSDSGKIARMMRVPGMPIVSSSGDDGFSVRAGQWPQSLTTVTSAGGTSLYLPTKQRSGYSEVAWEGAGSGCSVDLPPASGQPKTVSRYCNGHRAGSDLSAVADPFTGVAVYDSYAPATGYPYGFLVVGGTSVASPFLGGVYARAPHNAKVIGPNTVYSAAASDFRDPVIGTNAIGIGYCGSRYIGEPVCSAGPGWDGPTGRGTPQGLTFAG